MPVYLAIFFDTRLFDIFLYFFDQSFDICYTELIATSE